MKQSRWTSIDVVVRVHGGAQDGAPSEYREILRFLPGEAAESGSCRQLNSDTEESNDVHSNCLSRNTGRDDSVSRSDAPGCLEHGEVESPRELTDLGLRIIAVLRDLPIVYPPKNRCSTI